MPGAIAVVGAIIAGISTGTWVVIGLTVAAMAYSYMVRPDEPPTSGRPELEDPGLRLNTRSTQEIVRVVYGTCRVGGNDVWMGTSNESHYLWIVQTLGEGECDSIAQVGVVNQIWLGEKLASAFGIYAEYWFHPGASNEAVDPRLTQYFPAAADNYRNTCYILWKLTFDRNYFQNLPQRTVLLKGKKLYDFRDTTTAWSDNPVLALYDYLTNDEYGIGIASTKIDATSWTAAANYCDVKGWELNMAVAQNKAAIDTVREICMHFRGSLVWYDDKYYLRYADLNEEASLMTLTDSHIVQAEDGRAEISVSEPSRFNRPDAVRVRYVDADQNYVENDIVVGDETGVVKQLNLAGCTDREIAGILGVYNLERWQLDRTITGKFRDDCQQLEPHDVITFNSTALSIADQTMRVIQAEIQGDGLVGLTLQYEADALYNDTYDLDVEGVYTCTLPDPYDEPPSVRNVSVSEETYDYRLRTFTRLKVSFDPPLSYDWFDYVEVWQSFDDVTYEHMFNSTSDFEIANVEEGQHYYLRLKVVNIWGAKQLDANDYKVNKLITGYADSPSSLASLEAVVNSNAVNLYSAKVADPDVELYEFRLGAAWASAIFLAALRSPNLSLYGVKPGSHTFFANTLSNNGTYGATPRSATVSMKDPPDGWTVTNTDSIDTLVVNGTMEADANWANYGTPTANARSDVQAYEGTFSRKFTSDGAGDGIKSDAFTLTSGVAYGWSAWVYPPSTRVTVVVRKGDDSANDVSTEKTGLTANAWTFISDTFTATASGASAFIAVQDSFGSMGDFYVDNVCLMAGTYTNCAPVIYSATAHIKGLHSGSLVATYKSPIFDRTASGRYMIYALADIVFTGAGTTWADVFAVDETWDANIAVGATWMEIFAVDAAPVVTMKLLHGNATPPVTETKKLEILSCIETARYYQLEMSITDPNNVMYALIEEYDLKFCQ